jgi:hypothetical protein
MPWLIADDWPSEIFFLAPNMGVTPIGLLFAFKKVDSYSNLKKSFNPFPPKEIS